jgi:D-alanyl-lipoteichoic acid acyltransferase DltB (MBOAT superfamily)
MSWNINYVFLIIFTTFISFACGIFIEKTSNRTTKKIAMIIGITLSLAALFFFKYFNFFNKSIVDFFSLFSIPIKGIALNVLLPVGISFYTFQTLSYVIDVYKGEITAERHFGKYAVFVSFFPQLVAGPIERSNNLLPEIKKRHIFEYENAILGMKIMTWGFFKKLVVADNIAANVDLIYNNVQNYYGFPLLVATILFAFQIYCDFSGYSDIALGVAKLFDIKLMVNFKNPYFSASLHEFWTRWHISLSTWFRDYVYIPLGGNRVTKIKKNCNLLTTFLASGLWHGANWTFVLWGGLHGIYQVLEHTLSRKTNHKKSLPWILKTIIVFIFVCFAWIFFRANSISDALYIITHLFSGIKEPIKYFTNISSISEKKIMLGGITMLLIFDYMSLNGDIWKKIQNINIVVRYCIYFSLILIIIFFMNTKSHEFIYFQF